MLTTNITTTTLLLLYIYIYIYLYIYTYIYILFIDKFVVKCYRKYNLPLIGLYAYNFYYQNVIKFGFDFTLTTYKYIQMKKVHVFLGV